MLNPGQILDSKYEIIKVLGQGGMGVVYLCKNNRLGNLWAIKEVNSQWRNQVDFLAEPNILKNLSHIGIIRIIDIFYENDNLYIVEDYIEGKTLREFIDANGSLSSELVKHISLQLCSILDYLHSLNPPIVYRDLKPSNIMITPSNKVVLIDFGIARIYKEGQEGDTVILGSKGYIAPEQLVNVQSNAQTDIYSLGATMYYMITGKSISLPIEPMLQENYSDHAARPLVKVIQKALAVETENRYSDVKQMMSELNAAITNEKYSKTMLMNSHKPSEGAVKTVQLENKRHSKKTNLIIIAVLACIIALSIFSVLLTGNKSSDKNAFESPEASRPVEKTESKEQTALKTTEKTKPKVQPEKETTEQDTIIKGVLHGNNPVILSSGDENGKGKGKNKKKSKDKNALYVLDPAASISNSKLAISLTRIIRVEHDVVAVLSIQNTTGAALKLDLSKTYLVNGENKVAKIRDSNPGSMLSIPQSSSKWEVKLYFKDFHFKGSSYTLRTFLNSEVNKNIYLYIAIDGEVPKD